MFDLFKSKEYKMARIEKFCEWFYDNKNLISSSVENAENDDETRIRYLYEVQNQLALIYRDGYKGSIEFGYGFNEEQNKWELDLFHLGNKFLIRILPLIKTRLELKISDTWIVNIDK